MKKMVVCNQKMYLTYDEAFRLRQDYDDIDFSNVNFVVCPSYLSLDIFKGYNIGAQNCFYEDKGAFTGEISAYDLSLKGVKYVILGHYERRIYDTDEIINKKIKSCLKNAITPIICVGETRFEKEMLKTSSVLRKQINNALKNIKVDNEEIIIAYEPVYKIGTKYSLKLNEIEDTFSYITKVLEEKNISNYKILYGGSVNKDDISSIISDKIDGYLLGSSSINKDELNEIIKCINNVK